MEFESTKDVLNINVHKTGNEYIYSLVNHSVDGIGNVLTFCVNNNEIDKFHSFLINKMNMSNSYKVKQFTEESMNIVCPATPQKMNKQEVIFLIKMLESEIVELAQTVCDNPQDALDLVKNCIGTDFNMNYKKPTSDAEIIAQQVDAGVDMEYYFKNAMAKKGINTDSVFNLVHGANMAKKWDDGKFHRREDSKIIKSPNWKEPDIVGEINRQINKGAW